MPDGQRPDVRTRAATEIVRRRLARESLVGYAQAIEVPTRPVTDDGNAWIYAANESPLAKHHRVILEAMQACMTQRYGRLIIMAPPGSAKSVYASVVAPTWYMGRNPGKRIILASYASQIAERQSRRARQICRSNDYHMLFNCDLPRDQAAVNDWALDNGSEYMATGILAGVTGNRGDGVLIDDPVAGREEAESVTIRQKTLDAYRDDLLSRLVPGGWCVVVMTRWHEHDLVGSILPDDYCGASGPIVCRDGLTWNVLRIPAQCDRADDPIGREVGEYLWPEWFDATHWSIVQNDPRASARRTWASLDQQLPAPESGILFRRECANWYSPAELPERLERYMATDFAGGDELADTSDFTETGVAGVDDGRDLWLLDWDYSQRLTNVTVPNALGLAKQHKPLAWIGEKGVIEKVVGPSVREKMKREQIYVTRKLLPTIGDKVARSLAFRDLWEDGRVHLPRGREWATRLVDQLVAFPSAAHDDGVDVCGLFGRGIDVLREPLPARNKPKTPRIGTFAWLTRDQDEHHGPRTF
jgi:predicted phage terminase large subunit-like protein